MIICTSDHSEQEILSGASIPDLLRKAAEEIELAVDSNGFDHIVIHASGGRTFDTNMVIITFGNSRNFMLCDEELEKTTGDA